MTQSQNADLTKASWRYVVRKTAREWSADQCTDLAAALTYYSVLALFPAAIAILSLVGLVGQVVLAAVMLIVALLYYATPNVKQPKFRWVSVGAAVAVVAWVLASALFGFYVANFSSYDKTYGSLAGVIAFLLWLWITNLALLFGAELDAELERARELQAGLPAEETIQLPPRERTPQDPATRQRTRSAPTSSVARRLRMTRGGASTPFERWTGEWPATDPGQSGGAAGDW